MPDCAIFADTGWEPKAVYEHLDWLMSPNMLPFPVFIVGAGNMRDNLLAAGRGERWASIPAFARSVDRRGNVSIGMIRRQCTGDYKIEPIRRKIRELVQLTRKRSPTFAVVEQWIGISLDEVIRMKPSREAWQRNRWPLIEELKAIERGVVCIDDFDIGHPRFAYDTWRGVACGPQLLSRVGDRVSEYWILDPEADLPFPCLQTGRRGGKAWLVMGLDTAPMEECPWFLRRRVPERG